MAESLRTRLGLLTHLHERSRKRAQDCERSGRPWIYNTNTHTVPSRELVRADPWFIWVPPRWSRNAHLRRTTILDLSVRPGRAEKKKNNGRLENTPTSGVRKHMERFCCASRQRRRRLDPQRAPCRPSKIHDSSTSPPSNIGL